MRWRLSEFLQHQHALQDARKMEAEISRLKSEINQLGDSLQSARSEVLRSSAENEELLKQIDSYDGIIGLEVQKVEVKEHELRDVSEKIMLLKRQCNVLETQDDEGQHSGVSLFRCICGRKKSSKGSLYRHFCRCPAQGGVFTCHKPKCRKPFKCRRKLEDHVRNAHFFIYPRPTDSKCTCADCGGSFDCRVELTRLEMKCSPESIPDSV